VNCEEEDAAHELTCRWCAGVEEDEDDGFDSVKATVVTIVLVKNI